jgi:hypothetical protein
MARANRRPPSPVADFQDIKISDIKIGRCHRRDMGDLAGLAESIGTSSAKAVVAATAWANRPEAGKSDMIMPRRYAGRSG